MIILEAIGNALAIAGSMAWQILWPLVHGFTQSGVIQAVVRKERIIALMCDDSPAPSRFRRFWALHLHRAPTQLSPWPGP